MRRPLALAVVALTIIGCTGLEHSLLYHPMRYPEGNWQPPIAFEDAHFTAVDGTRLHGWYARHPQPRTVVLYCHGNAGNITHRDYVLWLLRDKLGVSVLVFDYRGFGKSEGTPSEAGILQDARAARAWLARAGVHETDIVLMGTSLGGGVAVDLAGKDGARGLVLENTFSSVPDIAASHFALLPTDLLVTTRLESAKWIKQYHGPLLQTHGDADRVIPFALGKKLFEGANQPKQFVAVPGGGHNDPPSREYLTALDQFFARLP